MKKNLIISIVLLLMFYGCGEKTQYSIDNVFTMLGEQTSIIDTTIIEQVIYTSISKGFNYESKSYTVDVEVNAGNSTLKEGIDFTIENKFFTFKKDEVGERIICITVKTASVHNPQKITLKINYESPLAPADKRTANSVEITLKPTPKPE